MAHGANVEHELSVMTPSELLKKLVTDVYFGNGKPALTVRVAGIEDQQTVFEKALEKQEQWQKSMNKLVIGTLISSVGGLMLIIVEMILRK